jgi:hypothetical protein
MTALEKIMCETMREELLRALREAGYKNPEVVWANPNHEYADARVGDEGLNDGAFGDGQGWPLVWRICERVGVAWGGGNHRNHQVDLLKPWKKNTSWGRPGIYCEDGANDHI